MKVSGKTIFEKIEAEMMKAKSEYANRELYLRRIANIKLLCELILDETAAESTASSPSRPTAEEIEQMMKGSEGIKQGETVKHDPESIFDF